MIKNNHNSAKAISSNYIIIGKLLKCLYSHFQENGHFFELLPFHLPNGDESMLLNLRTRKIKTQKKTLWTVLRGPNHPSLSTKQ